MTRYLLSIVLALMLSTSTLYAKRTIVVRSLAELARVVAEDGQNVKLRAGIYSMRDYLNADSVASRVARKDYQYITFSGSDNKIDMKGVVFEIDTELRRLLKHPIHTDEIIVSGDGNSLSGLTVRYIGDATSPGGCAFTVKGRGNTITNFTLHVQGSSPYGYGDLFGKGRDYVIKHAKHSGFLITGDNTTVVNCKLYMRSFGHAFFIQQSPENVTLIDCYAEGEIRATADILAESSGAAFDVGFRTLITNRDGERVVTTGYAKSLCEEGFRTYGACKNLRFINCVAKNTRGGFELRSKDESVYLDNCAAIGTERGFWVGEGAIVKGCRGDASNGALLFVEGNSCDVELELMATESKYIVHALATIHGDNNRIKISPYKGAQQSRDLPIMLGYRQPASGEPMAPFGQTGCKALVIENNTTLSIVVGRGCVEPKIETLGAVVYE